MKLIITFFAILLSAFSFAQKATLKDGVLSYNNKAYTVGDTVNIGYGTGTDGKFVFVFMGSAMTGTTPLNSNFSKSSVKIDKVYKTGGKFFARGKVLNSNVNVLGGNKVFIDIESAVDKKELVE